MPESSEKYVVKNGSIVGQTSGDLLYERHSIEGLSSAAKKRLAELHSQDDSLEWEGDSATGRKGAWDILIEEGLMKEDSQ